MNTASSPLQNTRKKNSFSFFHHTASKNKSPQERFVKKSENHLSVTYLLRGKISFCVMFLLSKDNCKHSMRAAAGFIHVGSCHSPEI